MFSPISAAKPTPPSGNPPLSPGPPPPLEPGPGGGARAWWHRIAFRLTLLVVAVSTLPPLILGGLAMRSARVAQETEVQERNSAVARGGVVKVQAYLDTLVETLRLVAALGELQTLNARAARSPLSYLLSFRDDVKEVSLLDADGRERVRLTEATLITAGELGSQAAAPAFQRARAGELYIGPVRPSAFAEPFVTVALPIRNLATDQVVGVLAVEVNLKRLWDDVLAVRVGQSGYLYLVNGAGQLLAHPDFSLVLKQADLTGSGAVQQFLAGAEAAPPRPLREYRNYQGVPVVGVHARSESLGWGVIVEQPTAEAFANVTRMKLETTLILLNTMLVTTVLALLASRTVTRPLAELARGARVLGTGDFSHTLPVRGRDELAEVSAAFNWMTANLRQSFQGLRTLLETTTRLAGVGGPEDVLRLAADETPRVMGDVLCAVLLLETGWDEKGRARARIWLPENGGTDQTMTVRPDSDHPVARALSSRQVVITHTEALGLPTRMGEAEAPALVVPLLAGQQPRGALLVVRSGGHRSFGETELTLCRTLANHLIVALQLREVHDHLVRSEKLRAVGEIAAGVAHNFNNVLGGILARAQLLQMLTDPVEIHQGLGVIVRAAQEGAGIVRRLQESARLQTATPFVPVSLNQVVRDALELTRPGWKDAAELRGKPIVVETALGEVPAVLGDPAELYEVVTNIVLNAVEAMPEGGRLRIETMTWDDWVSLTISDTGAGMSEDDQRRVFDPFFTTKGAKGTGLGMSVSYAIVKRHGGEILVDSAVGRGTTIRLRLRAQKASEAARPAPTPPPSPSQSCRILVADDDLYVRDALRAVLVSLGHRVETVESGQQVLDRFTPEAFDLVITDLGMELSGREVARAIKARSPRTPVIVVTGWAFDLNTDDLREAGADHVLAKPFQVNEVREVVAKALERRPSQQS